MKLHDLQPASGSIRNNFRRGRGQGSGGGGTATRGHKGAQSRSGHSSKRGFEGGQMPLQRRLPKFGFKNINRVEYKGINLDVIQKMSTKDQSGVLNPDFFIKHGLANKNQKIKILGRGTLESALTIQAHAFTATAKTAIESKGGKAEQIA
jgi:large subunit ribosomal protein L15